MKTLILLNFVAVAALSAAPPSLSFRDVRLAVRESDGKMRDVKGVLTLDAASQTVRFVSKASPEWTVKYGDLSSAVYGQNERNRVLIVPLPFVWLANPGRQNLLTLQYGGTDSRDYAVFNLGTRRSAEVVAALEAQWGKKVERSR